MTIQLSAIGLVAADIPRSLQFYRLLGLDTPTDSATEDHVEANTPGGVRVMWDTYETVRATEPDWEPGTGGQTMALAFGCDSPAEVDARVEDVRAAGFGVHHEPWDAFWGQRYATVVDPDGNHVDVFAALG